MRALTVQQPWAWALIHGGKDVENRTHCYSYRGPLAVHAGAMLSERGCRVVPSIIDAEHPELLTDFSPWALRRGAVIGVVDLIDAHLAIPEGTERVTNAACCDSWWAEYPPRRMCHLVIANPRPLPEPIPCRGRLGLWTPAADVLAQLAEQVPA